MGKNTNKKGKQKEASTIGGPAPPAPPPAPLPRPPHGAAGAVPIIQAPSPPAAKHIRHPPTTIGTIEEEDTDAGPSGGSIYGEDGWEDVGPRGDMTDSGWGPNSNGPGNGNEWGRNDTGWETNTLPRIQELPTSPPPLPLPPPPPPPPPPAAQVQPKNSGGNKAQFKQQRAQPQQHQHEHQRQHNANTPAMGQVAWNHQEVMNKAGWNTSKNRNTKDGWNNWAAENVGWGAQNDWPDQADDWDEEGWNDSTSNNYQTGSAWGHPASVQSGQTHATSRQQQGGWQNWSAEAQRLPKNHQPYPNPPNHGGAYQPATNQGWNQVPPKRAPQNVQQHPQQHFHQPVQQQPFYHDPQQPFHHEPHHDHHDGKKNKKNKQQSKKQRKHQQETNDVWELGDGWSDLHEEDENDAMQDSWGRKAPLFPQPINGINGVPSAAPAPVDPFSIHASPTNKLGLSLYTNDAQMSKTLSYAYQSSGSSPVGGTGRMAMKMLTDVHFTESHGNAINSVRNAFYNKARKAAERFHWLFPAEKDERVAALLDWIDTMAFAIASFGLQKFLHTRERGALVVNADYVPPQGPNHYALDWMTWDQIQPTMDRVLQESVGYYNPSSHVIVFVYLPSPSGNSVAIWRRKLLLPDNIRLSHQAQITQVMSSLRKTYPVYVDELPSKTETNPPSPPPKKKRKWYKLWLST